MINVLDSTLEWTQGEVIVNSGIRSMFSLDSASEKKDTFKFTSVLLISDSPAGHVGALACSLPLRLTRHPSHRHLSQVRIDPEPEFLDEIQTKL
jgi:hypothetical protein